MASSERWTCRVDEFPGRKTRKGGEDLLDSLPESLIYHIFSFLDTKDMIRTSALSRRWRFVWTESPTISLDYGDREEHDDDDPDYCLWVDSILVMSTAMTIDKFHLTVPYSDYMKDSVNCWMSFAVVRRVRDLRLGLLPYGEEDDDDDYYALPVVMFSCQFVMRLSLGMCDFSVLNAAGSCISWSSLKVLHIEHAVLRDNTMDVILKGSPILESIELKDCRGTRHVEISSTRLKVVAINGYRDSYALEISTPHLKSLKLLGNCGRKITLKLGEASSLVDAELDLDMPEYEGWEDAACLLLEGILRNSPGIDRLTLGSCFLKVLRILEMKDNYNLTELNCCDLILRPASQGEIQDVHGIATALKNSRDVNKFVIDLTPKDGHTKTISSVHYRSYFYEDPFERLNRWETTDMAKRLRHIEIVGWKLNDLSEFIFWLPFVKFLHRNGLLRRQSRICASQEVLRQLEGFHGTQILSLLNRLWQQS